MNLVAYNLQSLVPETDYTPIWKTSNPQIVDDPKRNFGGKYDKSLIFRILVTQNNGSGTIKLWAIGDKEPVEIPAAALLVGHTYDIYLQKYELTDSNLGLVGFSTKNMPFEL